MVDPSDYLEINKALWDDKSRFHVGSSFYKNREFLEGAWTIQEIESALSGNIKGKKPLHLQCHLEQDSLYL